MCVCVCVCVCDVPVATVEVCTSCPFLLGALKVPSNNFNLDVNRIIFMGTSYIYDLSGV